MCKRKWSQCGLPQCIPDISCKSILMHPCACKLVAMSPLHRWIRQGVNKVTSLYAHSTVAVSDVESICPVHLERGCPRLPFPTVYIFTALKGSKGQRTVWGNRTQPGLRLVVGWPAPPMSAQPHHPSPIANETPSSVVMFIASLAFLFKKRN